MASLRRDVLGMFKTLHKTRTLVFKNDVAALEAARIKINDEFKKNKEIDEKEEIEKLVKLSRDVNTILRRNVVQAVEKKDGVFELNLRPEVEKSQNVPYFGPTMGIEEINSNTTSKCCQEENAQVSKG